MSKLLLWTVIGILVVGGIVWYGLGQEAMKDSDTMMEKASPTTDAMMKKEEGAMMKDDAMLKLSGTVLAGTSAKLLDFNKADYDTAVASGKLVTLFFYANWCPICKEEFPKMQAAFNELTTDKVVGFRVNYNDNQTDAAEQQLAKDFGIAYQHTKVFLKNGERVGKWPENWEKSRFISEITSRIQ